MPVYLCAWRCLLSKHEIKNLSLPACDRTRVATVSSGTILCLRDTPESVCCSARGTAQRQIFFILFKVLGSIVSLSPWRKINDFYFLLSFYNAVFLIWNMCFLCVPMVRGILLLLSSRTPLTSWRVSTEENLSWEDFFYKWCSKKKWTGSWGNTNERCLLTKNDRKLNERQSLFECDFIFEENCWVVEIKKASNLVENLSQSSWLWVEFDTKKRIAFILIAESRWQCK